MGHQVIYTMIDMDALHHLNEWQGSERISNGLPPIVTEPPQDSNASDDEINHINNIFSFEELTEEQIHTSKEHFNQSNRPTNGHDQV